MARGTELPEATYSEALRSVIQPDQPRIIRKLNTGDPNITISRIEMGRNRSVARALVARFCLRLRFFCTLPKPTCVGKTGPRKPASLENQGTGGTPVLLDNRA